MEEPAGVEFLALADGGEWKSWPAGNHERLTKLIRHLERRR